MDARGLANQARSEAQRFASTLSRVVVARIERAVIAEWLDARGVGHLAAAAVMARQAIADLRTYP